MNQCEGKPCLIRGKQCRYALSRPPLWRKAAHHHIGASGTVEEVLGMILDDLEDEDMELDGDEGMDEDEEEHDDEDYAFEESSDTADDAPLTAQDEEAITRVSS